MRIFSLCLAASALALAGTTAALASVPGGATTADTAATAKPKEKRVCKDRGRAGSHLPNRVCKTPAEWAALQAEFDDQDEYGIPANKVSTAREINRSPTNISGGPTPR